MSVVNYTLSEYIRSRKTLKEKIEATELMISKLEDKMLEGIDNMTDSEYSLDDGQVKVRTVFRSTADVEQSLKALENMLQRYINQYNGRIYVMRGAINK